jgi:hypothetical protein
MKCRDEVDIDGHVDLHGIQYIGVATRQPSGLYHCLALVPGSRGTSLCRVEVRIALETLPDGPST